MSQAIKCTHAMSLMKSTLENSSQHLAVSSDRTLGAREVVDPLRQINNAFLILQSLYELHDPLAYSRLIAFQRDAIEGAIPGFSAAEMLYGILLRDQ